MEGQGKAVKGQGKAAKGRGGAAKSQGGAAAERSRRGSEKSRRGSSGKVFAKSRPARSHPAPRTKTGARPGPSRRREFCHFADTPSPSILKHLLNVEGGCSRMTVSPTATRTPRHSSIVASSGVVIAASLRIARHMCPTCGGSEKTVRRQ